MTEEILNKLDNVKKRVIEALIESKGIVTSACEAAQVPRGTFYWWINNDPDFKEAVEDVQDIAIDFVEGKLFDKITSGDTIATIFYLKTRGKKRGYIERNEITGADGNPLAVVWKEEKTYETKSPGQGADDELSHKSF